MPILTIRHVTTYHYRQPVAFGEHRMMLRPRDDGDQRVLESELEITPEAEPTVLDAGYLRQSCRDRPFRGPRLGASLRKHHLVSITRRPASAPTISRIMPGPIRSPMRRMTGADLARFIAQDRRTAELDRWAAGFLREDGSADTHALLVDMTQTIKRTFRHVARHQKGTQDPAQTLKLASGSCRDLAVLMIAALRSLGIAARFVSGYLHLADDDDDSLTGGNTHAWVQAYVPGPGWVDFDPSSGMVGNREPVRVAVVDEPHEAIPLQGTWIGSASDHLAMKVAVKVAGGV